MSNNDTRGFQYDPTNCTDRPQGQRQDSDATADSASQRNQAGTGASLQEYRFSNRNKARTRGVQDSTVDDVFDAIVETVEQKLTVVTLTSQSLKDDAGLVHPTNQIGKALRELAETDDCPVHVELWGGQSTTPQRWEVSIPTEPVGVPPERLKYSSRTSASVRMLHIDEDCDRLSGAKSITSTLATHPPRGEVCTLCAPDLSMDDLGPDAHSTEADEPELATDGGHDVSAVFSRLCELALEDGAVPDDGSGLDSVWTRTIEARQRDRDWQIAVNPDLQTDHSINGFPREDDAVTVPAGKAMVYLGAWPAGLIGPTSGSIVVEQVDAEPRSLEDELLRDIETVLLDAGAEIDRTIPDKEVVTDSGEVEA